MIRRTFLILTLIAVATLLLFARNRESTTSTTTASRPPPLPGYFMTDAQILQTAPDGMPLYRMTADRIQQNPETDTVRMRHLELHYRVTSPGAPARDWTLSARQGDMPQSSTRITRIDLSGNVELTGQPKPDTPTMRIRTQRISVDTNTNLIKTREPVDIVWGGSTLRGANLTANLKTGDIKMESKVNGRYKQ